ncbi:hypothetical protein BgAZ_501250 [Babesia gibsoni]|uniref:Uncharacterized protein n=1 Tax=Babesia gibsoni TaxID=33632 RepID=A0AAD8LI40_BABGI|nr:hypothetical protein BgAZ_501250 [Babesia gibsoni]
MAAQPAPMTALGPPMLEKGSEIEQEKSNFRQTIESIKQDASSSKIAKSKEERREETTAWRVVLYNDDIHR